MWARCSMQSRMPRSSPWRSPHREKANPAPPWLVSLLGFQSCANAIWVPLRHAHSSNSKRGHIHSSDITHSFYCSPFVVDSQHFQCDFSSEDDEPQLLTDEWMAEVLEVSSDEEPMEAQTPEEITIHIPWCPSSHTISNYNQICMQHKYSI